MPLFHLSFPFFPVYRLSPVCISTLGVYGGVPRVETHTMTFMQSIKQFFKAPSAKRSYHVDVEVPETIEDPVPAPVKKERSPLNLWAPWAAKVEAAKGNARGLEKSYHAVVEVPETIEDPMPMPMKKERSPLNLWAPWAAKVEAARAHAEFTE